MLQIVKQIKTFVISCQSASYGLLIRTNSLKFSMTKLNEAVVIIFQYMYRVLNMINFCSCSAVILSGPHPNFSQFFHKCRASQSYHHYLSPLRQWATRSTNAKFLIFNLF
ncbi:hypothetical protein WUBG_08064 [Wuchereria bancrofti]|uniref:Uncharacterized protein n=1 Tax=Wuchereria bancrofti TaxID=6293 RepID=J9EFX7_WUCBA|nr:hypothetical protein WUBG_08064 [Wuchereria bancrofti]